MNHTAETNLYAERDITERLREHAAIHEAQVPFDNEQREWADDLRFAAAEIARLRARVAKLESARGEPVAWMNPYGGTLQVRITGLEYEKYTIPLYTAPPAQAVDVDAISDEAIVREALRDAGRYRWLRGTIFLAAVDGYENSYRREKLDAFIDNAMAKDGAP